MSRTYSCVLYGVPARGLSRRGLKEFAKQLQAEVTGGRPFCCLVASDEELRRLNKQFRKKDYATDVLSFPLSHGRGSEGNGRGSELNNGLLGELAISWDRAKAQATDYGHTPEDEMRILMLHGVLHLTGLDHEKDRGNMARSEVRWRKRLNLPAGLIERGRS
jgi:probable rRNA maturation factor